jgi:hypothetical protein
LKVSPRFSSFTDQFWQSGALLRSYLRERDTRLHLFERILRIFGLHHNKYTEFWEIDKVNVAPGVRQLRLLFKLLHQILHISLQAVDSTVE